MSAAMALAALFAILTLTLIGYIIGRPQQLDTTRGRATVIVGFLVLPVMATAFAASAHLEQAKTTKFCLSCHEMTPYGESLDVDSGDHLPALHIQNRYLSRELACFDCHTSYTMFGDLEAKIRGFRHVWVHYVGTPPATIELYAPYQNRECLHCHADARRFEENDFHLDVRAELATDELSCLECHDLAHDLERLSELLRWHASPR